MSQVITAGPQYVLWNYTYFCNLNCQHCYSRASQYPVELNTEQYLSICDDLNKLAVFTVALGGGEVLFRKDAPLIVEALASAGTHTVITTNGWPVNKRVAERLKLVGLSELYVSIDSVRAAQHDEFRRSEGSWKKATSAVEIASSVGLPVQISFVITRENETQIEAMVQLAEAMGATGINFKRFRPSGNGVASRSRYELNDNAILPIERVLADLKLRTHLELTLNFGAEIGEVDNGCACGTTSIALRPNGDVALCSYAESILGNVTEHKLSELWLYSPILAAKRSGVSCAALHEHSTPSNPLQRRIYHVANSKV